MDISPVNFGVPWFAAKTETNLVQQQSRSLTHLDKSVPHPERISQQECNYSRNVWYRNVWLHYRILNEFLYEFKWCIIGID